MKDKEDHHRSSSMSSRFSNYKLSSYAKTQKKNTGNNDMSSDEILMNEIIREEKK